MENFSIYRYMKLGIVHFKAFPQATTGEGPIVETLRKIVEDDFWTAVEVGWMKDPKVRHEARKLLETSHLEICYANQPRMFTNKLDMNAFDPAERKKAVNAMKNGVDEAYQLGASCMRVFSGKHPGETKKEEAKKILVDTLGEVCRYTREQGPMDIYMKVFDYDIDKCFLIGHFQDAADVAEPLHRDERACLLDTVRSRGFIDNYRGIRISRTGRRFLIEQATVWTVLDEGGAIYGQAATFNAWNYLDDNGKQS